MYYSFEKSLSFLIKRSILGSVRSSRSHNVWPCVCPAQTCLTHSSSLTQSLPFSKMFSLLSLNSLSQIWARRSQKYFVLLEPWDQISQGDVRLNRWMSRVTITIRHLCSPSIFDVTPLCIINNIAISVTHGQQLWRVMIQMIPMSEPWLLKTTSPTGLSQPCGPALSLNGLWKHNTKQILANLSARALSILSNILNVDRLTI